MRGILWHFADPNWWVYKTEDRRDWGALKWGLPITVGGLLDTVVGSLQGIIALEREVFTLVRIALARVIFSLGCQGFTLVRGLPNKGDLLLQVPNCEGMGHWLGRFAIARDRLAAANGRLPIVGDALPQLGDSIVGHSIYSIEWFAIACAQLKLTIGNRQTTM